MPQSTHRYQLRSSQRQPDKTEDAKPRTAASEATDGKLVVLPSVPATPRRETVREREYRERFRPRLHVQPAVGPRTRQRLRQYAKAALALMKESMTATSPKQEDGAFGSPIASQLTHIKLEPGIDVLPVVSQLRHIKSEPADDLLPSQLIHIKCEPEEEIKRKPGVDVLPSQLIHIKQEPEEDVKREPGVDVLPTFSELTHIKREPEEEGICMAAKRETSFVPVPHGLPHIRDDTKPPVGLLFGWNSQTHYEPPNDEEDVKPPVGLLF